MRRTVPHVWTVREEPPDSAEAVALLREYFAELIVRWSGRATTEEEIDETVAEYPSTGLAAFLVLRADGEPAGCLGVHPTGEITRMYVSPRFRRRGGARALLAGAEAHARARGLARLFLDTRADLVEARALYVACGFTEIPPATAVPGPFQDHWFEKRLDP
jgi:ribosomal protein S18 acetylase RimI-like enzyme